MAAARVIGAAPRLATSGEVPREEAVAELHAITSDPVPLGYALGVKNTFTMNVEFYTGIDERLEMPMILPPVPDLVDFRETRVLIADDVADTGATLALVKGFCAGKVAEARCAVLYEKPRSTIRCEYVWRRTDRWITFPWSADEPVGAAAQRL